MTARMAVTASIEMYVVPQVGIPVRIELAASRTKRTAHASSSVRLIRKRLQNRKKCARVKRSMAAKGSSNRAIRTDRRTPRMMTPTSISERRKPGRKFKVISLWVQSSWVE